MNALEDLTATILTIRQRIEEHRASMAANETRTRQVLIDPLLTALGWDVTNPALVTLEYDIQGQKADYALHRSGQSVPVAVVEAKSLQKPLDDRHKMQVLNYANTHGIKYMAITNGDDWLLYDVFKSAPLSDRILMKLKISTSPPHENAIQSLRLWNPNLASDTRPVAPVEPVFTSEDRREKQVATKKSHGNVDNRGWIALNDKRMDSEWKKSKAKARVLY